MGIQLSALRKLGAGPISGWQDCPLLGEGVALLVEFTPIEAIQALYGLDVSSEGRDVPLEEFRDFYLARVKDWRGIEDGDAPAPFDRAALIPPWEASAQFRAWLIGRSQTLASFLGGADEAPAVAVRSGSKRPASRRGR